MVKPRFWKFPCYERKSASETLLPGKVNLVTDTGSAGSSIQYRLKNNCLREQNSDDTFVYKTTQQTSRPCASVDKASSLTTPKLGPGLS